MRYSKQYLKARFQYAAELMGWDIAGPRYTPCDGHARAKVGHIALEHNSVYGWNINQVVNEGGGERRLLESCTAAELNAWLSGVIHAATTRKESAR